MSQSGRAALGCKVQFFQRCPNNQPTSPSRSYLDFWCWWQVVGCQYDGSITTNTGYHQCLSDSCRLVCTTVFSRGLAGVSCGFGSELRRRPPVCSRYPSFPALPLSGTSSPPLPPVLLWTSATPFPCFLDG
eukprot:399380-Pyramimonas_sp.AAC.1